MSLNGWIEAAKKMVSEMRKEIEALIRGNDNINNFYNDYFYCRILC